MTSKPKKRNGATPAAKSTLLSALEFCKLVTKDEGAPFDTHVIVSNHTAVAFNGILACGVKIENDLVAAPDNYLICQALAKCGDQFSITQLDNNRLSIKAGKFKAIIPCIAIDLLNAAIPDPPIASIDSRFKVALEAVAALPSEGAQSVIAASVLMAGGSLIATDRHVMIEYWHGIDLPTGIALPKAFATALGKSVKPLAKFGFSNNSATFHFSDDSWLRTQFFAEPWPDVRTILDRKCNAWPVPNDFWNAFDAVESFSDTGDVYFDAGIIRSHASEGEGASYECYGIPKGPIFSIRQLQLIRPLMKSVDFQAPGVHDATTMLMFYGDNCRGAIAGRSK